MKRYRVPILYDCDDLPKKNSIDVYEADVVDKEIKFLDGMIVKLQGFNKNQREYIDELLEEIERLKEE